MSVVEAVRAAVTGHVDSAGRIEIVDFAATSADKTALNAVTVRFVVVGGSQPGTYRATVGTLDNPAGTFDVAWYAGLIKTHIDEVVSTSLLPGEPGQSVTWEPWTITRAEPSGTRGV
ncbi:hypothetical protein V5P93_007180 [Actinokineospora auranticolor]|uniref:Uncharacterized protein n=1 Tax=Actinokineospora auranticolor TaxID=155976 RepID=A0A2S6GRG5_9PSEU|nr:hypothetical protein [Actinokineospora auranticolor]PPK67838.1 hypothetical protein CLV40_10668 [Actinokineospora auranticolor]